MRLPVEAAEFGDPAGECGVHVVRQVFFRSQNRRSEEDFSSLKPKE
jgi:hypothetical protein